MIYQIIIEKGELVMTAKESGMEEYIAYVSELYKMPFSISDMPEKKKDYHRKKTLRKEKILRPFIFKRRLHKRRLRKPRPPGNALHPDIQLNQ